MPTYEYECKHCKHRFEVSQRITASALEKCPECGKPVKRLISSGVGVIFKGAGFYATDYRKGGKPAAHKDQCSCCPKSDACPGK